MLRLEYDTPAKPFQEAVMEDFTTFLQDHAANERKVAQASLTLVSQYPKKTELVKELLEIAQEELEHFSQVTKRLHDMGVNLDQNAPDPYMSGLHKLIRKGDSNAYLLDRLVIFAVVEARGCERFNLVTEALEPGEMKTFYAELTQSEARHHGTYLRLARQYFPLEEVKKRLAEVLAVESEIVRGLPFRAALH